jgi:hypothetical protein
VLDTQLGNITRGRSLAAIRWAAPRDSVTVRRATARKIEASGFACVLRCGRMVFPSTRTKSILTSATPPKEVRSSSPRIEGQPLGVSRSSSSELRGRLLDVACGLHRGLVRRSRSPSGRRRKCSCPSSRELGPKLGPHCSKAPLPLARSPSTERLPLTAANWGAVRRPRPPAAHRWLTRGRPPLDTTRYTGRPQLKPPVR